MAESPHNNGNHTNENSRDGILNDAPPTTSGNNGVHPIPVQPAPKPTEHRQKAARSKSQNEARKVGAEAPGYSAIQEMLASEGATRWDRNVPHQLHEFMYQITSQILENAQTAAKHRDSNSIGSEDVDEALDSFSE
jgi:histone H3/H4